MKTNFISLLFILLLVLAVPSQAQSTDYSYYCYGNCNSPVDVLSYGGFLLVGGGTDVDDGMKEFVRNSGGGDILVLRASGSDGYNRYLYRLGTCNSVSTIVFNSKLAAQDPFVLNKIDKASGVFFAGGDQSVYMNYWKDTPVQTKLNDAIARRNIPVGGTSAGMAILTEYIYSAEVGSAVSSVVLNNPYDASVTFKKGFLFNPLLTNMIDDQHFYQRDRMGRLLVFMARIMKDNNLSTFRGLASDESNALFLNNGVGTVYSQSPKQKTGNFVYFLQANAAPSVCQANTPLTFQNIKVYRLKHQEQFNLNTWTPVDSTILPYTLGVSNGVITSTKSGGQIY